MAEAICVLNEVAFSVASDSSRFFVSSATSAFVALSSQCVMVSFATVVSSMRS